MDRAGRGSHGCAGAACARAWAALVSATKLPVCWQAAALPSPHLTANQPEPCAIGPEACTGPPEHLGSGVVGKLRAGHLVVLALGRGARAPVRHATDTSKAAGDGQRSTHKRCRVLGLPATPGGAAPSLGAQCSRRESAATRRRRRCAAHVARQRSPGAPIRADAVEQQESRDAAAAADTINDGLALRRDGQEGRELPWV